MLSKLERRPFSIAVGSLIAGTILALSGCDVNSPYQTSDSDSTKVDSAKKDSIKYTLWDVCAVGRSFDYRGDSIPFQWSVTAILGGDTVSLGSDSSGCVDIGAQADTTHFELLETWSTAGSYERRYFRAARAFEFEMPWRKVPLRLDTMVIVSDSLQRESGW